MDPEFYNDEVIWGNEAGTWLFDYEPTMTIQEKYKDEEIGEIPY